ncbi:hypothetical protein HYU19_03310 [Candidatus Woesearchaeota archaeon]|nr:hypothetical protein [Candidatus Woesearchaeota archaeon]
MLPLLKRFRAAPLSSGFFAVSIIGGVLSLLYYERLGPSYAFSFLLLSIFMFIASFISMTRADVDAAIVLDHQLRSGKE